MHELGLQPDEGIILQTENADIYDDSQESLRELYLTNKNIICVVHIYKGLFKQGEIEVRKFPLSSIKIINGVSQVKEVKNGDTEPYLQILFIEGDRLCIIFENEKKVISNWISEINHLIVNNDNIVTENKPTEMLNVNKPIVDSATNLSDSQVLNHTFIENSSSINREDATEGKNVRYCSHCGSKLIGESNFCPNCGKSTQKLDRDVDSLDTRTQVFEGEIHKCPNCGEVLSSFSGVCPACGYEIRNGKIANSVEKFSNKIEQANTAENKALLIRNFPISNTKEDILEFMILATSNINNETNEEVFNAWLSKMEQCYQKAAVTFGNTSEFDRIQNLYEQANKRIGKDKITYKLKKAIPNPVFAIVAVLLIIFEVKRIASGDFAGIDIIFVAIILWSLYKNKKVDTSERNMKDKKMKGSKNKEE